MSKALETAAAALRAKFAGAGFESSVRFEIEGEGSIRAEGDTVEIGGGEAEVTIIADLDTFRQIFDGELSATAAYMTGRMRIEGSMGVAMKLSQILG